MNKSDIKQIRSIASRLPVVYEQTVSGFYKDFDENGEEKLFPNIVNHEVNHVRRMRKAYEKLGMDGIRSYLDMINKLQTKRNDLYREQNDIREEVHVDNTNEVSESGPVPDGDNAVDPGKSKKRNSRRSVQKGGGDNEKTV